MKKLRLFFLFVFLAFTGWSAEELNVLVLSVHAGSTVNKFSLDKKVTGEFDAENIRLHTASLEAPLSQAMLRSFNAVVILDWEGDRMPNFLPKTVSAALTTRQNLGEISRYVAEGGALFYSPCPGGSIGAVAQTRFLKPFGAELTSFSVRDDVNAFITQRPKEQPDEYAFTTNIASHPATKDVKTIFYPQTQLRWDDMYANGALHYNADWKILVRGMKESSVARCFDYNRWEKVGDETAPPLVAVRDFGKGRIGILGVSFYYSLFRPYDDPPKGWIGEAHTGKIDGVFLHKGNGKRSSDGFRLMVNLFRYISEPGLKLGLGRFDKDAYTKIQPPASVPMPAWLERRSVSAGDKLHKILIGPRSSFSSGEGTIAEYARAAEAAGVSVLVMSETFEEFKPARWTEFQNACFAASTDKIAVVPGLDIPDPWGNRFLLYNTTQYPPPSLLTPDGRALAKVQYLCLCFPQATTIAHRVSTGNVPHEMIKHFQGISVYTYNRQGELADNSLPAYEWQIQAISNPIPFAVHEIQSPKEVASAASTGHQVYVFAPTVEDVLFYASEHGVTHFWENPTRWQVSSGPLITELGGKPYYKLESPQPIKEVRLYAGQQLMRRWLPNAKTFETERPTPFRAHIQWGFFYAEDTKGGTSISPALQLGQHSLAVHTWRCGDRQNWWNYPNIYTGTYINSMRIKTPVFGALEMSGGRNGYPSPNGPLRGDSPAPILDFPFPGAAVYIQDVALDQRYPQAVYTDTSFDAKNANPTTRARVSQAYVRYYQYFEHAAKGLNMILPLAVEARIRLLRPVEPESNIFPVLTELRQYENPIAGDMSYRFRDPNTNNEVAGVLKKGETIDIPRGGRIGGLIVLSELLRASGNGTADVGFAATPDWATVFPKGTEWNGAFAIVPPAQADRWRKLLGLDGEAPYAFALSEGKVLDWTYRVHAQGPLKGEVTRPLAKEDYAGLNGIPENPDGKKRTPVELTEFRLPFRVAGLNPNFPAALWMPGRELEAVDFFENEAWARVDMTQRGPFAIGNIVTCDAPALRIGLLKWTPAELILEINNPTSRTIKTALKTWIVPTTLKQGEFPVELPAGTSKVFHFR